MRKLLVILLLLLSLAGFSQPALRSTMSQFTPSLVLDFTQGVMPSGLTFTRSSIGTRVNASGLIETVAANQPRFDYDPVTLAPKGLLMEEQRTNVLLNSSNFSNASWTKSGSGTGSAPIVTANWGMAPDGTNTASRMQFDRGTGTTASDFSRISSGPNFTGPGTMSVWLKSNNGTNQTITILIGGIGSTTQCVVTPTWTRFSCTYTGTSSMSSWNLFLYGNVGANSTADILTWGAQVEAGTFFTSYIPTTTAAVTRAVDVCTMSDISSWYNQNEGSILFEWTPSNPGGGFQLDDGTQSNRFIMNSAGRYTVQVGGVFGLDFSFGVVYGLTYKAGLGNKGGNYSYYRNNALIQSSTSLLFPSVNTLRLGKDGGSSVMTGYIRRFVYYPRRLPNSLLQSLTQ